MSATRCGLSSAFLQITVVRAVTVISPWRELEIVDDQRDEMHAGHVETVPAAALGVLAKALEISLAVVDIGDVVFARNVEDLCASALDDLLAGVDQKRGRRRHRLDLGDRLARVAVGSGFGGR
jgi:hypothetical protein